MEKLALLARVLPAYTGHPKAAELTEQMLLDTVPIEMGYARRGWFLLKIPALLPKKGTGSPIYIQQYLYPALRRYFDGKPPACYRSCVLAYRHVYQRGRPERAYRCLLYTSCSAGGRGPVRFIKLHTMTSQYFK